MGETGSGDSANISSGYLGILSAEYQLLDGGLLQPCGNVGEL